MDPGQLEAAFREKPAVHRFPGNMARRVQELCATIVSEYGGDAARVWTDAKDDATTCGSGSPRCPASAR